MLPKWVARRSWDLTGERLCGGAVDGVAHVWPAPNAVTAGPERRQAGGKRAQPTA